MKTFCSAGNSSATTPPAASVPRANVTHRPTPSDRYRFSTAVKNRRSVHHRMVTVYSAQIDPYRTLDPSTSKESELADRGKNGRRDQARDLSRQTESLYLMNNLSDMPRVAPLDEKRVRWTKSELKSMYARSNASNVSVRPVSWEICETSKMTELKNFILTCLGRGVCMWARRWSKYSLLPLKANEVSAESTVRARGRRV